ncbi:UPF0489 family protein [Pseudalkalibacillus salsuginis]|uniref:UPF0489 family protein n=1 Tax=Pseudalkalibacillus salsuginis TaxID=2910972 RepID=UPI001F43A715|nr:UPF0489 family protein [Pseudalkalibacillus salsuginis]MCF6412041.1 UPF0489 family protein [Pseudalkalibacillus salsuginis]
MDIFDKDLDWKVQIPEKNMYIMKDHSWAFAAWEIERLKGNLLPDSVLLHFDYHLDDVPDGLLVDGVLTASTKEELFRLTRTRKEINNGILDTHKIYIDNFIWPSFARGTLGSMFVIAPQNLPDIAKWVLREEKVNSSQESTDLTRDEILQLIPKEKFNNVYRSFSLEEFEEKHLSTYKNTIKNKGRILDIDLDYFNKAGDSFSVELATETEIKTELSFLLHLCKWDLITVALSPVYCGGDDIAEYLLKLFMEVAELDKL